MCQAALSARLQAPRLGLRCCCCCWQQAAEDVLLLVAATCRLLAGRAQTSWQTLLLLRLLLCEWQQLAPLMEQSAEGPAQDSVHRRLQPAREKLQC